VTERDGGGDPLGDFQRWLMKAGARSVTKDLTGRVRGGVRGAIGGNPPKADVWDTATSLPLADGEAPECAWCPVCRAARRMRERQGASSGTSTGLGSQLAGAGDALAAVVQEAYSAFESAMKPPGGGTTPRTPPTSGPSGPGTGHSGPTRTGPADPWEDASRDPDDWR
jgi:hypothetical protein